MIIFQQLLSSGEKVDEKVWRMPLHKKYDKLLNSKNADMQNINYVGGAGSTTAAQFTKIYFKRKHHGHLDIAGMAFPNTMYLLNSRELLVMVNKIISQLMKL